MQQEIDPRRVHLIERDDLHLVIFKDTLEFSEVPAETADEIRPVLAANSQFVDELDLVKVKEDCNQGFLHILQFNISEDCNLQCAYCVAKGGSYGRETTLMSPETARLGVERFFNHYHTVQNIQFFGGEPFLNPDAIEAVCEALAERKAKNPDFKMPYLNVNTNGTIVNERVIQLIKKYNLQLVVSIDGPREIHDHFRRTKGDAPTFDTIIQNVHTLFAATGQPAGYEMVLNTDVLQSNWTLLKILEHFEEILPNHNYAMYVAPMVNDESNPKLANCYGFDPRLLEFQYEVIRVGFDRIREGKRPVFYSEVTGGIRGLMGRKKSEYFCGMCRTKLMVDGLGNIVPCNAVVNMEPLIIGHISDPTVLTEKLPAYQDHFIQLTKTIHFKECADCWAFNLCRFCMSHIIQGCNPDEWVLNPNLCDTHRKFYEELLIQIVSLHRNPTHWERFMAYLHTQGEMKPLEAVTPAESASSPEAAVTAE